MMRCMFLCFVQIFCVCGLKCDRDAIIYILVFFLYLCELYLMIPSSFDISLTAMPRPQRAGRIASLGKHLSQIQQTSESY